MNIKQRRKLIEQSSEVGLTLEGAPCSIGGWSNEYATLAAGFGGFWSTSWETAQKAIESDGKFYDDDVVLVSWRWLGYGLEVPDRLKHWISSQGLIKVRL